MTETTKRGSRGKVLIGASCGGCLVLIVASVACGAGGYFYRQSQVADEASAHADELLGFVKLRDWNQAYYAAVSHYSYDLYSVDDLRRCFSDTTLPDPDSGGHFCVEERVEGLGDEAWVRCTWYRGGEEAEAVLIINDPVDDPYLGFIWFDSEERYGDVWASDECACWSGSEGADSPPPGFVRPPSTWP